MRARRGYTVLAALLSLTATNFAQDVTTPAPTPMIGLSPMMTDPPTPVPTPVPTPLPTAMPTPLPTNIPTPLPTGQPTLSPTPYPTSTPTPSPSAQPTTFPTPYPTGSPTLYPTPLPTATPTPYPTMAPSPAPTFAPTPAPTPKPSPEPPVVVALNLTFTIRNVAISAPLFNVDWTAQGVIKDALTMSLYTIKRQEVGTISAMDGYLPTMLRLQVPLQCYLQDSGYSTSIDLFQAIVDEFTLRLRDGTIARNIQRAATTGDVPALESTVVESDSFQAPPVFAVNGQVVHALPKTISLPKPEALPLSVVLPSIFGGLLVFAAMFHYSRARAENFRTPDDPLATLATAAAAARDDPFDDPDEILVEGDEDGEQEHHHQR